MEKSINEIQPSFLKPKQGYENVNCNRKYLIKQFLDTLNGERLGTKYPPLKASTVAMKISHLSEFDLAFFLKQCQNSKTFTGCFWSSLKNK